MRYKLSRDITRDEVCAYRVAGVVLLRGVLDLATVNLLRRCIDDGMQDLRTSPKGYESTALVGQGHGLDLTIADYVATRGEVLLHDGINDAGGRFYMDTALAGRHDAFRKLVTRGPFAAIAGALLDSIAVRYHGDQFVVKEPRTSGRMAFRQDASYVDIDGDDCCVLWAPTDPVTFESGALQYVRGSHRDGRVYAPNVVVAQTPLPGASGDLVPDIENHSETYDLVHFTTEPGDVIVHHYRTVHGAGGNLSRYQVQRAAAIRYAGDDIRYKPRSGSPKGQPLRTPLQEGDRLGDMDFPVVWRSQAKVRAA